MLHLLPPLIAKLKAAESAHTEAAKAMHELVEFLELISPKDIRSDPPKTSWRP